MALFFAMRECDPDRGADLPYCFSYDFDLAASPDRVFDLLAAPETWVAIFPGTKATRWLDAPALGARREVVTDTATVIERFTRYEPGRRLTFHFEKTTLPIVSQFLEDNQLEAGGRGTLLRWRVHFRPRLLVRAVLPLVRPRFEAMFSEAARRLPTFVEERKVA